MDYAYIYKEANKIGKLSAKVNAGDDIMIFPCGFAWVKISQKDEISKGFVSWLKENNIGSKSLGGGYEIWIHDHNQSMLHKEHHAIEMAEYLRRQGINAISGSRID
jgi:hypothetical protein